MAGGWRKSRTGARLGPERGAPEQGDHTLGSSFSSPQSSRGDPMRTGELCLPRELESSHGTGPSGGLHGQTSPRLAAAGSSQPDERTCFLSGRAAQPWKERPPQARSCTISC